MPLLWSRGARASLVVWCAVETPHFEERQAQAAEALEQAVEGGLIGDWPEQQRRAVAVAGEREAGEVGGPALVEMPLHADAIVLHPPLASRLLRGEPRAS